MTTPEPVSPAPDTEALRQQVADLKAAIADIDAHATPIGLLHEDDPDGSPHHYAVTVGALHRALGKAYTAEPCDAERQRLRAEVAGLRADLDQRRAELAKALYAATDLPWEPLLVEARHVTSQWLDRGAKLDEAARSGARPIPDDAAEPLSPRRLPEVHATPNCACGYNLAGTAFVDPLCEKFLDGNRHGSTPTTDPAPAAADVQWGVQRADGVLDQMDDEDDARRHLHWFDAGTAHVVSRTVVYGPWTPATAAPQAPAEPTTLGPTATWPVNYQPRPDASCPACRKGRQHSIGDVHEHHGDRIPELRAASRAAAPHEYVDSEAIIRATPAAREDVATPPLPLHEQADLLTWRVVHVPPGTTDREDTDTPITPGWWLVGHGEDPDHPEVQVHLGDRLPTSSAATPGDEYNDDLGGWARPTPIQPEEA